MFRTLLSRAAACVLDVGCEPEAAEGQASVLLLLEEEDTISINVQALYALLPAAPQMPWREMAGFCGSAVGPMYRTLQSQLSEDVENVAALFAELEMPPGPVERLEGTSSDARDSWSLPSSNSLDDTLPGHEREVSIPVHRRRRVQTSHENPHIIRNDDPTIPTIIITPCEPQRRESSCWVPFQDACFGNRLVVPAHPVANDVYPPLLARPLPLTRKWEYANGHWRAVLPTVDEQIRRGMFSRALTMRRRARYCRSPHAT